MPTGTVLWPENTDFIVKQADFNSYDWTNAELNANENIVNGKSNEGIILELKSTDLGPPNHPKYASLVLYYTGV